MLFIYITAYILISSQLSELIRTIVKFLVMADRQSENPTQSTASTLDVINDSEYNLIFSFVHYIA
jgi:hypothetical protein